MAASPGSTRRRRRPGMATSRSGSGAARSTYRRRRWAGRALRSGRRPALCRDRRAAGREPQGHDRAGSALLGGPDRAGVARRASVLISAHGNSLRALVKHLSNIPDDEITGLEIPTGQPIVYELDEELARDRPLLSGASADEANVTGGTPFSPSCAKEEGRRAGILKPGSRSACGCSPETGTVAEPKRAHALIEKANARPAAPTRRPCWRRSKRWVTARPQSWQRALDYLELAASRGVGSARRRSYVMLGTGRTGGKRLEAASRQRGHRRAHRPRRRERPVSERPRSRVDREFRLAGRMRLGDRPSPAARLNPRLGGGIPLTGQQPIRTQAAPIAGSTSARPRWTWFCRCFRARISAASNLPLPVFEPAQIMHYSVGQEFRPHHRLSSIPGQPRMIRRRFARLGQRIATFLPLSQQRL